MVMDPCQDCRGQGQIRRERTLSVRIPAGVDDGARIRLAGEGDAGARGGPRGDLYIFISVHPHGFLRARRAGPALHGAGAHGGGGAGRRDRRALPDGRRGLRRQPPTADRRCLEGDFQTGRTVRLKGNAACRRSAPRERGDLVVELFIETPGQADRPPEGAAARPRRSLQRPAASEERQLRRQGQDLLGQRQGRLTPFAVRAPSTARHAFRWKSHP